MKASDLQALSLIPLICITDKLPMPVAEYKFHPTRKWRFDWCWPDQKVALEIEGGVYATGRHTRGKGYENDCRKYNAALLHGWKVLRATTGMAPEIRDLLVAALK
jgi:very-short-patch-repair endonuclease